MICDKKTYKHLEIGNLDIASPQMQLLIYMYRGLYICARRAGGAL